MPEEPFATSAPEVVWQIFVSSGLYLMSSQDSAGIAFICSPFCPGNACWIGLEEACRPACREEVNGVLEKARGERFLGSALEAKVLLHVADAELAESLQALQGVSLQALHSCLSQIEHRLERMQGKWPVGFPQKALELPTFLASPVLAIMQVPCHAIAQAMQHGVFGSICLQMCLCVAAAMPVQAGNVADPLRYAFIVSQAELVADKEQVASCSYSNETDIEGFGAVSVGVSKADGQKCLR